MPFSAYTNAAYFILRSGGQALITFLFDSCFAWGGLHSRGLLPEPVYRLDHCSSVRHLFVSESYPMRNRRVYDPAGK